jgi:hypothetical protein
MSISVTSKVNSTAIAKLEKLKLNANVKNITRILFFIKFYYRDEINY